MGRIDESKVIYPLFLLGSALSSILPLITCLSILAIQDYEMFRNLLNEPYLQNLYFARIILKNLDYMNFSLLKCFVSFFTSLRFVNIVLILMVGYLWCAKEETYMKFRNYKWKSIMLLYLSGMLLSFIVLLCGFKITSVGAILLLFKSICIVLALTHILLLIFAIFYLLQEYFFFKRNKGV